MFMNKQTCFLITGKVFYNRLELTNNKQHSFRDFEFPADRLSLGILLGSGAFGRVLKAEASGIVTWEPVTTVAVKMVKPQADITYIKELMAELKIMIHLGRHLNIVNLLGACTVGLARRELLVIVEYCRSIPV